MSNCPCGSDLSYESCCAPYHKGLKNAEDAKVLMRSRYSAFAKGMVDYLISTTHPKNPHFDFTQLNKMREGLLQYCHKTTFTLLEILQFKESGNSATVTFKAYYSQDGKKGVQKEKSRFLFENNRWLYFDGEVNR